MCLAGLIRISKDTYCTYRYPEQIVLVLAHMTGTNCTGHMQSLLEDRIMLPQPRAV